MSVNVTRTDTAVAGDSRPNGLDLGQVRATSYRTSALEEQKRPCRTANQGPSDRALKCELGTCDHHQKHDDPGLDCQDTDQG